MTIKDGELSTKGWLGCCKKKKLKQAADSIVGHPILLVKIFTGLKIFHGEFGDIYECRNKS